MSTSDNMKDPTDFDSMKKPVNDGDIVSLSDTAVQQLEKLTGEGDPRTAIIKLYETVNYLKRMSDEGYQIILRKGNGERSLSLKTSNN